MNSLESIEEFYKRKLNWVPDSVRQEIGHFNVFRLEPFVGKNAKPVPYSRRDYFKISLIKGNNKVHYADASRRITTVFLELLERQFPIDDTHQRLNLRTPAAFADQLAIHVNHLNRALKKTTEKSTSEIIQERILQEAKILLKHSAWNISEIAYALGFNEVTSMIRMVSIKLCLLYCIGFKK